MIPRKNLKNQPVVRIFWYKIHWLMGYSGDKIWIQPRISLSTLSRKKFMLELLHGLICQSKSAQVVVEYCGTQKLPTQTHNSGRSTTKFRKGFKGHGAMGIECTQKEELTKSPSIWEPSNEREIVEPFPQALAQQISGKAGLEVPTFPQKAKGCRAGDFRGFSVMIWTFWISRSQADRGIGAVLQWSFCWDPEVAITGADELPYWSQFQKICEEYHVYNMSTIV